MKFKALTAAIILAAPAFANATPYTLFAGKNITLHQGTNVTGDVAAGGNVNANYQTAVTGNVLAKGAVTVEQQSNITGNVSAGEKVHLKYQASVGGNVSTSSSANVAVAMEQNAKVGGTVTHKNGTNLTTSIGATHGGNVIANVAAPSLDVLPGATAFTAGGNAFNLNANSIGALGHGSYGQVKIGSSSTLKLTAGDYYFSSLEVNGNSKIIFDLAGGDINLFITGNVNIGQRFDFEYLNGTIDDIYTETKGNWEQGGYGEWFGTLFASGANSNMHFSQNSTIGGSFTARNNLQLDIGTIVTGLPPAEEANEGAELPTPGSMPLIAAGLLALALFRRRKAN